MTCGFIHKLRAVQGIDRGPSSSAAADAVGGKAFAQGALAAANDLGGHAEESEDVACSLDGAFAVTGDFDESVEGGTAVTAGAEVCVDCMGGSDFDQGFEGDVVFAVFGAVGTNEVPDLVVVLGVSDRDRPGDPVIIFVPAGDPGVGVFAQVKGDAVAHAQLLNDLLGVSCRGSLRDDREQSTVRSRGTAPPSAQGRRPAVATGNRSEVGFCIRHVMCRDCTPFRVRATLRLSSQDSPFGEWAASNRPDAELALCVQNFEEKPSGPAARGFSRIQRDEMIRVMKMFCMPSSCASREQDLLVSGIDAITDGSVDYRFKPVLCCHPALAGHRSGIALQSFVNSTLQLFTRPLGGASSFPRCGGHGVDFGGTENYSLYDTPGRRILVT
ncbi:hypothetical protein BH683_007360 [Williamsia sp. 1138]|nr:hypothetical protein BH683_007360 [Williamsia sp. 1138]